MLNTNPKRQIKIYPVFKALIKEKIAKLEFYNLILSKMAGIKVGQSPNIDMLLL